MRVFEELLPDEIRYPQEMKCPVCFLPDTSSSMMGSPISELNKGLASLKSSLMSDDKAKKVVDLSIVSFGGTVKTSSFCTAEDFNPTPYAASGGTPMGEALLTAIDLIERRKGQYRKQGINKYRPWLVLITDGAPTDMHPGDSKWTQVVEAIRNGEQDKKFIAWAFGVRGANLQALNELLSYNERVYALEGYDFAGLFQWVSDSMSIVTRSKEGQAIEINEAPGTKIKLEA